MTVISRSSRSPKRSCPLERVGEAASPTSAMDEDSVRYGFDFTSRRSTKSIHKGVSVDQGAFRPPTRTHAPHTPPPCGFTHRGHQSIARAEGADRIVLGVRPQSALESADAVRVG